MGWQRVVSDRDVEAAFGKVKQDINAVRQDIAAAKALIGADKKELHEFINAATAKLDRIENNAATKEDLSNTEGQLEIRGKELSGLSREIKSLRNDIEKASAKASQQIEEQKAARKQAEKSLDEKLRKTAEEAAKASDISEVKSQLATIKKEAATTELRIKAMPGAEPILKRLQELEESLAKTRRLMQEADVKELKAELAEVTADFTKLGSRFVSWQDSQKAEKRIEREIRETEERISSLKAGLEAAKASSIDREEHERAVSDIRSEMKATKESLNTLLKAEVDLGEYATREELRKSARNLEKELEETRKGQEKRLLKLEEEHNEKLRKAQARIADLENSIEILSARAERASAELSDKLKAVARAKAKPEPMASISAVSEKRHAHGKEEIPEYVPAQEKGMGTYLTAIILILILIAAGYYIYTQLAPGTPGNYSANYSQAPTAPAAIRGENKTTNETDFAAKNKECFYKFECLQDNEGNYYFECKYDLNASECKCYKGANESCTGEKMEILAAGRNSTAAPGQITWPKYTIHIIAIAAIAAFTAILIYLFKKGEEAEREEEEKTQEQKEQEKEEEK
ncbi:hypothetical protein HYY74_08025 [Candidatus Woesearchaeota archaeon]|nr:hypothetical protein [Candidatus Woesearchaeota archaeon]